MTRFWRFRSGVARIRLAPLALLLIASATAIPIDFEFPEIRVISWSLAPRDFVLNVILFVPLGAALGGRRWYEVAAVSGLLSLGVEVLQIAQAARHAGPADIVGNVAGGLLGYRCGNLRTDFFRVESGVVAMNRWLLLALALFAGSAPLLGLAVPGARHDFSNWESSYGLAISDEFTRDRSWRGTLMAWAVYDRPLHREAIRALVDRQSLDAPKSSLGELPPAPVASWKNPDPRKPSGFLEMSSETSTTVFDRLQATGTMSLLAWIRVNDLEQTDLERIVTFSRDQYHRNLTLGQNGGALELRIRTPATGLNGIEPDTHTSKILEPGRAYSVAATYDGFVSRIFVDGQLLGRKSLAASAAAFPALHDGNLPGVLVWCGGCLAAVLIALLGSAGWSVRCLLGCVGGLVVVAVVWALGTLPVWPVHPAGPLWRILPPIAGGMVVALSLAIEPPAGAERDVPGYDSR